MKHKRESNNNRGDRKGKRQKQRREEMNKGEEWSEEHIVFTLNESPDIKIDEARNLYPYVSW